MSNLTTRIADIQRELLAIKAGFSGTAQMFTGATVTTQSFNIVPTTSMLVTVDFEYRDFPDIFITGVRSLPSPAVFVGYGIRRSLYEWYIEYDSAFGTIRWDCILFSERPPTLFTLAQV